MKLKHISITARNADELARFYSAVFGYKDCRTRRTLSGEHVWRGNGLAHVNVYSIWLSLPDTDSPVLELLQYADWLNRGPPVVNQAGYGHIAFEVEDVDTTYAEILKNGGTAVGEITNFGATDAPHRVVYVRDPEGNILEIEES